MSIKSDYNQIPMTRSLKIIIKIIIIIIIIIIINNS